MKKTRKLLYKGTLDEVFQSAYDEASRSEEWKLLGEDAANQTSVDKPPFFQYLIGLRSPIRANSVSKNLPKDSCVEKIYKVLLSEEFARKLLSDAVVDIFYTSGSVCTVFVKDEDLNSSEGSGIFRDFYVEYSYGRCSASINVKFKVTCDIKSGKIKDGSVYVVRMDISNTECQYRSSCSMGYYGLLDELRKRIDNREEVALEKNRKRTPKRMRLYLVKKSPFETGESLKDTFLKYPTPEVLLRDLKCSNQDWYDGFLRVSHMFRGFETSEDGKSQYAQSGILFNLQGKEVSLDSKGIPRVCNKDIPSVERPLEFKQVCKVLLSVSFAEELLGDFFIRSFLEKDGGYESSITVSFKESVGEENVFDFYIKYCQKNAQSCRVHIEFNVCYDACEGRFKRDEKGNKVRITHFSIGKFRVLPLTGKVLRNDDLKCLGNHLSKRKESIRDRLFSCKRDLFISIIDQNFAGGWKGIRSSMQSIFPYQNWSGICIGCENFEDHDPENPDLGNGWNECSFVCGCRNPNALFKFMYNSGWIDVKDWLMGGEVVLCKNGYFGWYGEQYMETLGGVKRYWEEKINPEKILIDREKLMGLKNWEKVGFEETDWSLLESSVFMVGEVQSDEKSKKDRQKGEIFKKFSESNAIREEEENAEEE